jgi:hypothetical protein
LNNLTKSSYSVIVLIMGERLTPRRQVYRNTVGFFLETDMTTFTYTGCDRSATPINATLEQILSYQKELSILREKCDALWAAEMRDEYYKHFVALNRLSYYIMHIKHLQELASEEATVCLSQGCKPIERAYIGAFGDGEHYALILIGNHQHVCSSYVRNLAYWHGLVP